MRKVCEVGGTQRGKPVGERLVSFRQVASSVVVGEKRVVGAVVFGKMELLGVYGVRKLTHNQT